MARARSVLTRDERIKRLREADRWQEGDSPFGLPKVRVYKLAIKKKKKKKKEDEEGAAAAEGGAPAAAEGGAAKTSKTAKKPAPKK
jgi:small basic protein (TIGR04137 family)